MTCDLINLLQKVKNFVLRTIFTLDYITCLYLANKKKNNSTCVCTFADSDRFFYNIWFIIYKEIVYFTFYFFASLKTIGCCSSQVTIYVSCFFHFRACVRYFFKKFLFFHQMIALQKR